jgi:hypothetical protein
MLPAPKKNQLFQLGYSIDFIDFHPEQRRHGWRVLSLAIFFWVEISKVNPASFLGENLARSVAKFAGSPTLAIRLACMV